MKLTLRISDQWVTAWFEYRDTCDLRISLSAGLSFPPFKHTLQALQWKHSDGEQLHFAGEQEVTSFLFTRKWNQTNQELNRKRALVALAACGFSQLSKFEVLDKGTPYAGPLPVAVGAHIDQLVGLVG